MLKFELALLFFAVVTCGASYHEQYRVPIASSERWEAYVFQDKEYLIQNLPVTWENAKILCRGHHNASLAILDTREKAEFLAEALSELQFSIEAVWVGAKRDSADDPEGYRWGEGVGLRRTAGDILTSEQDGYTQKRFPVNPGFFQLHASLYSSLLSWVSPHNRGRPGAYSTTLLQCGLVEIRWLNRTHVPVPEGGADCVALERVNHDLPVFLDLPCQLERPFVCERDARVEVKIKELKVVRCRTGLYRLYDGRLDWAQAAAYCLLKKMTLATIATMKCLRKLGLTMLKSRPSIESAWVGGRGSLGQWTWLDSGVSIFHPPVYSDVEPGLWPPMRDSYNIKQNGCLQLDRHSTKTPVFLEARCERRMQFICYSGSAAMQTTLPPPSDENYYYVLVRQQFYWQHAFENCQKMNGSLASVDSNDILIQLLLVMGENKDEPVEHVWIAGRLNMTRDPLTDLVTYAWYNPSNGRRIPDPRSFGENTLGLYIPPWLTEDFTTDSPCLNLDRQDHLNGLLYGLPCDTPQYSVCMIEKTTPTPSQLSQPDNLSDVTDST